MSVTFHVNMASIVFCLPHRMEVRSEERAQKNKKQLRSSRTYPSVMQKCVQKSHDMLLLIILLDSQFK